MHIGEGIETGREYYWKRSDGWLWDGVERWWEVFVEFDGFNGAGGVWLREKWRWNGSGETIREQPQTLSAKATDDLLRTIRGRAGMARRR